MQRVFTILDKPKHPQNALAHACRLRETLGSKLTLAAFCYDPMAAGLDGTADSRRQLRKAIVSDRNEWLYALAAEQGLRGKDIRQRVIWSAAIDDWIARFVNPGNTDLVIKTAHPAGKRFLNTPLDWSLLERATVPIWFVRSSPSSGRRRKRKGPVLATIDLRHDDRLHRRLNEAVLTAAAEAAALLDTGIHCVSVVEFSRVLRDLDLIDPRAQRRRYIARAQDRLSQLLDGYDIPASAQHFPMGKVGQCVLQVAAKQKAQLLVVGTNARRSRQTFTLGNSAQKILSRADRDVLAVHG